MTWAVTETSDVDRICDIHLRVFGEDLAMGDFEDRKRLSDQTHLLLVREKDGATVGFGIFHGHGSEVDFWLGGVEPGARQKGAGSTLLVEAERLMRDKKYESMTVTTYNIWASMIRLLLKHKFRIIGTRPSKKRDDVKILLRKAITIRKELRYSLTEKCNFRCIFCHNEGLPRSPSENRRSDEDVLSLLLEAVRMGFSDITFTGGEPLLEKDRVLFLISQMGNLESPPSLTLVTNGSLVDDGIVEGIRAYPGKIKVHVSLHASDASTFTAITGRDPDTFEKVKNAVRKLTDAGITVKANHVVLQGLNHDKLPTIIDLAFSLGANVIKFLELLVVEANHQDFRYLYKAAAIRNAISRIGSEIESSQRRVVYSCNAHPGFLIEVEQLTCALGCIHCREVRDKTLSSELNFHPCFYRCEAFFPVDSPSSLREAFLRGDRLIDGYAFEFGESSPTLAMRDQYVMERCDAFFFLDDYDAFKTYLKRCGFHQTGSLQFRECHYRPRSAGSEWIGFQRSAKYGIDLADQTKVEFFCNENFFEERPEGYIEVTTRFLDPSGPIAFLREDLLQKLLIGLDMEFHCELSWELETLQRKDLKVSLGMANGKATLRLPDPIVNYALFKPFLDQYDGSAGPLQIPLLDFVLREP